jgi:hypothetical protein
MPDTVIWSGPEHGDGETLKRAYRRITGRELDLERYLFVEELGWGTRYHFHDDVEVTVAWEGICKIERVVPCAGSVCSAHRTPEPGCPLCGLPGPGAGAPGLRREGGGGG